jgi:NAD(P)H-dependent FMN reductase
MILVFTGTNRPDSKTMQITKNYVDILRGSTSEEVRLLPLEEIQEGLFHINMYEKDQQAPALRRAQDEYFIPAGKWIIVSPEYNGSYPGAVKLLLDALSVRKAPETFHHKKVALVGISSGRTGNWLGMNQLTSILNYLKMNVYFNKLAISHIDQELDEQGNLLREKTRHFMQQQIQGFLDF